MFVTDKPFHPSLLFVSKVRADPSEAPMRCSTLFWAPGLTHKHYTRLEILAMDKDRVLLQIIEAVEGGGGLSKVAHLKCHDHY